MRGDGQCCNVGMVVAEETLQIEVVVEPDRTVKRKLRKMGPESPYMDHWRWRIGSVFPMFVPRREGKVDLAFGSSGSLEEACRHSCRLRSEAAKKGVVFIRRRLPSTFNGGWGPFPTSGASKACYGGRPPARTHVRVASRHGKGKTELTTMKKEDGKATHHEAIVP